MPLPALSRKACFFAQLVKEAGEIRSEAKLAKMLCYIEKERGVSTGFTFDKNQKYGHYTFEIKEVSASLQQAGLLKFREEDTINNKRHIFTATGALKKTDLPLSQKEKAAVRSIYREFSKYSTGDIESYDHDVYRNNKIRTDVELREATLKKTNELIKKHNGNEEEAFKEWLSG